jgi:hypothetical protein
VAGHQIVDGGQGSDHSPGDGRVAGLATVGVDPHDVVREIRQSPHLVTEQGGVAPFPPVGANDHRCAAGDAPLSPPVKKGLQRLPQPGPAAPVRYRGFRRPQRQARVAKAKLAGDPGQPGADREDLGRPGGHPDSRVGEPDQPLGVGRHRAADVEQEDEPAVLEPPALAREVTRLAPVAQHRAHGPGDVGALPSARDVAGGAAAGHPRSQHRDHPVHLVAFPAGELGQVTVPEHVSVGRRDRQHVTVGSVVRAGLGAAVGRHRPRGPGVGGLVAQR